MPLTTKSDRELTKLKEIPDHLGGEILGQSEVIPEISEPLQNAELGLRDPERPKASFMFLGPTGVGKTEVTRLFTSYLYDEEAPDAKLVRFDMSEFQTRGSVTALINLIAFNFDKTGGEGTILFDEIEKAEKLVLDLLLQILDAARITVPSGETLNLSNYYIVLTSNIGAKAMMDVKKSVRSTIVRFVERQAQMELRPELFARVDRVCVFNALSYDDQVAIATLMLGKELRRYPESEISYEPQVLEYLAAEGFHPRLGARRMRAAVEKNVRRAIRNAVFDGKELAGLLTVKNSNLELSDEE